MEDRVRERIFAVICDSDEGRKKEGVGRGRIIAACL